MDTKPKAPAPLERPRFAAWLHARGLVAADAASVCRVGREQVRRYCLPFDDAMNVTPSRQTIEDIFDWTDGEIGPADWYPARLSRRATNGAASAGELNHVRAREDVQ